MSNPIEKDAEKVGLFAREIVLKRVAITGGASTILDLLVQQKIIPISWDHTAISWLATGLNVLAIAVGVIWARGGTTPADPLLNPTSNIGEPLVAIAGTVPPGRHAVPTTTADAVAALVPTITLHDPEPKA